MKRNSFSSCWTLVVLAALALPAGTSTAQHKGETLEQLASGADVVAVGTVTGLQPEWNADGTRIRTVVTLSVEQYLKGGSGAPTFTLATPGGEIGEIGEVYSHVAAFKQSEQVVVFAERDGRGGFRTRAGELGKFTVTEDRLTGARVVTGGVSLEVLRSRVRTAVESREQR